MQSLGSIDQIAKALDQMRIMGDTFGWTKNFFIRPKESW